MFWGIFGINGSNRFLSIFLKYLKIIKGSGKTTFLNYLSGRLVSKNLLQKGKIILNNEVIENFEEFNDVIGYVIQEDIVLETLTPRG